MGKPVSYASAPTQPDKDFYGLGELALFSRFTRASYRTAFGIEAPAFDPQRAPKGWFDSAADASDASNVSVYRIAARKADGSYGMRQMVMPSADAATVNLPGPVYYPPYVIAPTTAKRTGPGTLTPQSLNPEYLSSVEDARKLLDELKGTEVVEEPELGGGFGTYFPPDESRRLWDVVVAGKRYNASRLLQDRWAQGIGSPGHWDLKGEHPKWVPDQVPVVDESVPEVEMPIRDLLPSEELRVTLMGVGVARKDGAGAAGGAGFTADDRAMLSAIYGAMFPNG